MPNGVQVTEILPASWHKLAAILWEHPMTVTYPLDHITAETLRDAEYINAADPNLPGYSKQLWGMEILGRVGISTAERELRYLRIEIDSTKPDQLQRLLDLVEAAKGRLPETVQNLRKPR